MPEPLDHILFISVPETCRLETGAFRLDPAILLPVEIPPGEEAFRLENLSLEMLVSGMLKFLASRPDDPHADYYRNFILAAKPDIREELTTFALDRIRKNDFEFATEMFRYIEGLDPGFVPGRLNLALLYEQRAVSFSKSENNQVADELNDNAFHVYSELLRRNGDDPDVLYHAGHFFLRMAGYDRALDCFETFLSLEKGTERGRLTTDIVRELRQRKDSDGLFKQAYDFITLGREDEALEKISAFLTANQENWTGWFLLGWAHRRKEAYAEAKDAFEKAFRFNPDNVDTLNELAICTMELGDFEASLDYLEAALQKEPENVKILSNLGICHIKRDDREKAKEIFRIALELAPDDPIATHFLGMLETD